MKVLVLGARGMMGHMACRVFKDHFDVLGTVRGTPSSADPIYRFLDARDLIVGVDSDRFDTVEKVIETERPDVVLNCIGIVKQLREANDAITSIRCNSLLPHLLADVCGRTGIRLIHLSTDCVFSGRQGFYSLDDAPDPIDLYGRSKLLGELRESEGLTIRTSIVGRQLHGHTSLFGWALANRGQPVRGFTHAIYSGLTTQALADVLRRVIEDHHDLRGVWQVASEPINKFDLIGSLSDVMDLEIRLVPDDTVVIDRSLDGSSFRDVTGIHTASWVEMLNEFAEDSSAYDGLEPDRSGRAART